MRTESLPLIGAMALTMVLLSASLAGGAGSKEATKTKSSGATRASTAPVRSDGWPDTREGALGRKWVEAFSAGEAAMRKFYAEDLAEPARAERSVEGRLARYRELRETLGELTFGSVTKQSSGELTVTLLDAEAKTHTFIFKAQTRAPFRLLSVSMTQLQHGGHGGFHH